MSDLFNGPVKAINLGVKGFADGLNQQGTPCEQVQWKPPVDVKLSRMLLDMRGSSLEEKVNAANAKAFQMMVDSDLYFVGIKRVKDTVPGIKENTVLHSGPPIEWERMLPIQKNGIVGAVMHEKLAKTREEALGMVMAGEIEIGSANDYFCVGAGAGIISPSMVVNISVDRKTGLEGYCIPFEGREGLAVWGVYNDEVEKNLQIIENEFAPAITCALEKGGGIDVKSIIARGLQMGDDMHTRQTAANLILVSEIVPMLLNAGIDSKTINHCVYQFTSTERWFHPLALSSDMAMVRGVKGLPYCTLVTTIAQNGVDTGIKVGDSGEQWFTAPSPMFVGQYFSTKWGPEDAAPFMGDSTIAEVCGQGGFAGAAAPGVMRLRGGGYKDGIAQSEEMMQICQGINHKFPLPALDFTGPGMGIDIRKVVDKGIAPVCHGGIISKTGGQIGAGAARFPITHFVAALTAFGEKYQLI